MIFKVYVQEQTDQVPVRERTKAIYLEGESEREIRKKMTGTPYLIEAIVPLEGPYLEYEKEHVNFKLTEL
jgi:Protein of unknown function (DUF1447).